MNTTFPGDGSAILYLGDSLCSGFKRLGLSRSFYQLVDERLLYELKAHQESCVILGHGQTTQDFLDVVGRWEQKNFGLGFILWGPNDASIRRGISLTQFGKNFEVILQHMLRNCMHVCYIVPPHERAAASRCSGSYHDLALSILKQAPSVRIVDASASALPRERSRFLDDDGFHINSLAHLYIARCVLLALDVYNHDESPICRTIEHLLKSEGLGLNEEKAYETE
jgi:hypothetical protein